MPSTPIESLDGSLHGTAPPNIASHHRTTLGDMSSFFSRKLQLPSFLQKTNWWPSMVPQQRKLTSTRWSKWLIIWITVSLTVSDSPTCHMTCTRLLHPPPVSIHSAVHIIFIQFSVPPSSVKVFVRVPPPFFFTTLLQLVQMKASHES